MTNEEVLAAYELHMRTARYSPVTICDRLELLRRLAKFLAHRDADLATAVAPDLEAFQQAYLHLSRASMDIYTRHVVALYRWLVDSDRLPVDPTRRMVRIRPRQGLPHPIDEADLRLLLATALGGLRLAYVLAAFAGLRSGEITRLRGEDLNLTAAQPTGFIQGKGGRERIVPLLDPLVQELQRTDLPPRGVLVRRRNGLPYTPAGLSSDSSKFMRDVGVASTLHSLRHYFATQVVRQTKDVLLTRDLLGHSSLQTTQIYMASNLDGTRERLAGLSSTAAGLLANEPVSPPLTELKLLVE